MSRLRVNRISPRTGSTVTIDGWQNQALSRVVFGSDYDMAHGEDITESLQDLLDELLAESIASSSVEGAKKIIELPHGDLFLSSPVVIRHTGNTGLTIRGAGTHLTQLTASSGWYGPMLVTAPAHGGSGYDDVETGTSLYATGTASLRFRRSENTYFLLSDALRLDGLEAFTIEFRTMVTASHADYAWMGTQSRRGITGDPVRSSLLIQYNSGDGGVFARINIGGTVRDLNLSATELSLDTNHDIRITYDGSILRAFLDGTQVDTEVCSGAFTQAFVEDFCLGAVTNGVFENSISESSIEGYIENVRISSTDRSSGSGDPYTPSEVLFTWDADTLFLWTGATDGLFAVARVGSNAPFYMTVHRQDFQGGVIQRLTFEDFAMHGQQNNQWLEMISTVYSYVNRIYFQLPGPMGARRFNNSFLVFWKDCQMFGRPNTQAIMCQTFVSGFGRQDNIGFNGGIYQHAQGSTSADSLYNNYYVPSTDTVISFYGRDSSGDGSNQHWVKVGIGQENEGADWECAAMFVEPGSVKLDTCELEGQSQPTLKISAWREFKVFGGRFGSAGASHVIEVLERGEQPAEFDLRQRTNNGPAITWVNSGFEDAVIIREFGQVSRGIYDAGNSGTTKTLDSADGTFQKLTATGNCTVTLTMSDGHTVELHYLTGAGSFAASFTSVTWVGGSAPTLTATATKLDIFRLWKTNGKLYGEVKGQNLTP